VLHYGEDPGGKLVDHINRNPFDNRVSNLRLADHSDNAINVAMYRHNKTGVKGVSYHARDRVFFAQIKLQQKAIHLGSFKTLEDAANARRAAELALCGQFSALAP
jgi:O-acetylhomoserine/O-acetylserine sulfhydrylase-like pyridoxal-dependent enzyme